MADMVNLGPILGPNGIGSFILGHFWFFKMADLKIGHFNFGALVLELSGYGAYFLRWRGVFS